MVSAASELLFERVLNCGQLNVFTLAMCDRESVERFPVLWNHSGIIPAHSDRVTRDMLGARVSRFCGDDGAEFDERLLVP
jgi:hypothetical protein